MDLNTALRQTEEAMNKTIEKEKSEGRPPTTE
jgi:hypothetical protein